MRLATMLLLVALGVSVLPPGANGQAPPVHPGDFAASASVEDVRYEFFRPVVVTGVDAAVSSTLAEVATYGLREVDGVARARADQADIKVFGAPGPVGSSAEQVATRGFDVRAESDRGATAFVHGVDLTGGVCPGPSTDGSRRVADASVASGSTADDPVGGALRSSSRVDLLEVDGTDGLSARAQATATVGAIDIANSFRVSVVGTPTLTVTASGNGGGAEIAYSTPVVEVTDLETGEPIATLDASDPSTRVDLFDEAGALSSFMNVRLGAPHDDITLADGTYARATVDVVEIWFTDPAGSTEQWDLRLGTLSAEASAPRGGVRCDGAAPPARDPNVPHVLVFSGWRGFEHLAIRHGEQVLTDLAVRTGAFTVEFTDNPNVLHRANRDGVDVFLNNNATGNIGWTDDEKALFESWLACGLGFAGVHAAADANTDWDAYGELIGARFDGHPHTGYWPSVGEVTMFVEDQVHPATAPWHGMESFQMPDELYRFTPDPRGTQDVNVLVSLDETTTYPWVQAGVPNPLFGTGPYGPKQPLAWTKSFRGHNRVFYTNLGHNEFTWDRPDFQEHLLGGLSWVTGRRPDSACVAALGS